MSARRDLQYIEDIAERVRRVEEYTQAGREAFLTSPLIQDAVVRNLEIIGEAAKNLSPALRQAHQDLPWRQMGRFRDLAIHGYFNIRADIVWTIVDQDLPTLKQRLPALLTAAEQAAQLDEPASPTAEQSPPPPDHAEEPPANQPGTPGHDRPR